MSHEADRKRNRFGKPFESQLKPDGDGCLIWQGWIDKDGYGVRGVRLGERRAHRHAYILANGSIPDGQVIRHSCDKPSCCNPDHLVIGTPQQNIEDKVDRNRQAVGRKIRTTRMTAEAVLAIRECSASGMRQVDIAERFDLDQTTVSQIVRRKTWKHL